MMGSRAEGLVLFKGRHWAQRGSSTVRERESRSHGPTEWQGSSRSRPALGVDAEEG